MSALPPIATTKADSCKRWTRRGRDLNSRKSGGAFCFARKHAARQRLALGADDRLAVTITSVREHGVRLDGRDFFLGSSGARISPQVPLSAHLVEHK